jgi:hypothetical protein
MSEAMEHDLGERGLPRARATLIDMLGGLAARLRDPGFERLRQSTIRRWPS